MKWKNGNKGRVVNVLEEDIEVYTDQRLPYRKVYRNNDTRSLDELFGLDRRPIIKGSPKDIDLDNLTSSMLLGKAEVYFLLKYFVSLTKTFGCFVGLPEAELIWHARNHQILPVWPGDVEIVLRNDDTMDGKPYIKRINVQGINVIFPQSLAKFHKVYK